MSYHQLNDQLYQIELSAENMQQALAVFSQSKLTKKQQQALEILQANTAFVHKTSGEARAACATKLDQALETVKQHR